MANICDYEVHVRGNKKAVLGIYAMLPVLDEKRIVHEEGTDSEYIIWIEGDCKWELDYCCKDNPDIVIDLDGFAEDTLRNGYIGDAYGDLTMRQKSELLGVEILVHSKCPESGLDQFDHYLNGELVNAESEVNMDWSQAQMYFDSYQEYCQELNIDPNKNPPIWYKDEFETYEEFCEEYGIDPEILPEDLWFEDDDDVFLCDIDHSSKYTFEF
jgi:hypothetical protein